MNEGMSMSRTNSRQNHKGAHCEQRLRRAFVEPWNVFHGDRGVWASDMEYGGGAWCVPSKGVCSVSTISIVATGRSENMSAISKHAKVVKTMIFYQIRLINSNMQMPIIAGIWGDVDEVTRVRQQRRFCISCDRQHISFDELHS